jgi:hypothetical protein
MKTKLIALSLLVFSIAMQGQGFSPPPMQQISQQMNSQMQQQQMMMQQQQMMSMLYNRAVSDDQRLQYEIKRKEKMEIKIKELETNVKQKDSIINKVTVANTTGINDDNQKVIDKEKNQIEKWVKKMDREKNRLAISEQKITDLKTKIETSKKELEDLKQKEAQEKRLKIEKLQKEQEAKTNK